MSRATPSRADARRNEERIFAAATAGFSSDTAPDMAAIARAAGVGVGTLYRRYGSRSGLVAALWEAQVDELVANAGRLAAEQPGEEALERWLREYVAVLMAKRAMMADLRHVLIERPELVEDARKRAQQALQPLLPESISAADVLALVDGLVGACADGTPADLERRMRLILRGLRED